jgi:NTE family protein
VSGAPSQRRPRRALVFSGGGARGAYEAGVVRFITDQLPKRLGRPAHFDIVCGTSVGAIHACYVAATADLHENRGSNLVDFWTSMRIDEMMPLSVRELLRLPGRLLGMRRTVEAMRAGEAPDRLYGLVNTSGLEKLVVQAIPWRRIRSNVREGLVDAVCVPATQIGTGRVVIFMETRERNLPRWTRDPNILPRPTRLLPTHALASAAIPLLFPAVRVASTYYADGGLRLNTPLAPALRLGADRVLVVALRQDGNLASEATLMDQRVEDYGSPLFLFGKVLNALLLDHLDTDLARMHVMNEILSDGEKAFGPEFLEKINETAQRERGQTFRRIDDLVIRPSADLGRLAGQILMNMDEARQRSPLIRMAARNLTDGTRTPESDLLSYLLFDGEFLAPLAELGYRDAEAREDDLAAFFTD